jgi:hypothetical protein
MSHRKHWYFAAKYSSFLYKAKAQKCGGVQVNIIKNNITAIRSIWPVIAVQPSSGGVAPAAPPITIFCGVFLFKYNV